MDQSSTKAKLTPDFSTRDKMVLIMKGGGIKGLAYVGAIKELEKHFNFTWYAGTSAGAITALLLAAGYTTTELEEILAKKDFSEFKDAKPYGAIYNFITKRGLYEGHIFTKWLDRLLAQKLDQITEVLLEDLPYRVSVYASQEGRKALIFDSTDEKTKHNRAAYAARCSMSIPIFFTPQKHQGIDVFDGGMQNNYPVELILSNDSVANFIGLYLGPETFEGYKRRNLFSTLINLWQESVDIEALKKHGRRTIMIDPRPISTLSFKLNQKEKKFLVESGAISATKFLLKNNIIQFSETDNQEFAKRANELSKLRRELIQKRARNKYILIILFVLFVSFYFTTNTENGFKFPLSLSGEALSTGAFSLPQTELNIPTQEPSTSNFEKKESKPELRDAMPKQSQKKAKHHEFVGQILKNGKGISNSAVWLGDFNATTDSIGRFKLKIDTTVIKLRSKFYIYYINNGKTHRAIVDKSKPINIINIDS